MPDKLTSDQAPNGFGSATSKSSHGFATFLGWRQLLTLLALVIVVVSWPPEARPDERESHFESKIRPVLIDACLRCHGATKASGGLRLDSREGLLKGGESGPAVVPGQPDDSLLLQAIRHAAGVSAMPPEKEKALKREQIEAVASWIQSGAVWPAEIKRLEGTKHWAFEPIRNVPQPRVKNSARIKSSVDAFLLAAHERAGIELAPPAQLRALIRRASFDLTGLPPSIEETEAVLADSSSHAFEKYVDRLLASPRYGEHWGRHWLDLVRYADTAGENSDHPLPHAWRYRNWVINAFNRNQPFDDFLREQIAGDLIAADGPPEKYADRVVATGYLAIARRFGHEIDKEMHLTFEDVIDTMGKSLLGLTLGCCRCHDHKYDPLSARDYYGLYGIFESTKFAFPGCEPQQQPRDLVPLMPPSEFARSIQPLQDKAAALDAEIKRLSDLHQSSARRLKEAAQAQTKVLSAGEIADATGSDFVARQSADTDEIVVKRGDVLLLSVTPKTNHGADSTLVEFAVREVGGEQRQWSTADLIANLPAGNPHPGVAAASSEAAPVWCFLDLKDGIGFLSESLVAINGRRELKAWRNGDTPSVFVNSSDQPVTVWTTLPPKTFLMHPGQFGPVGLAWLCPVDGKITVKGRIADAHPGGDGVGWIVEHLGASNIATEFAQAGSHLKSTLQLRVEREQLKQSLQVPVAYAVAEGAAKNARQHKRGEPMDLGDEVPRKFLDVLGGETLQDGRTSGRRELAQWLTSARNPLTPRVFVNRVWQWHFGRGLVTTPNDFGSRGAAPTHPDLLDHLASEFLKSGWDIKALHRRIMHSAAYQATATSDQQDSYAAFRRRRLTAEELRDALLVVNGELDVVPGESHPFPPESTWGFTQHGPFAAEYETNKRSVYVMQKRNRRTRFFALFDGPDPNASTPLRDVTTVPTQALFFLNDPLLHARAEKLAARMTAASTQQRERVDFACRTLFGRPAHESDLAAATDFLADYALELANLPPDKRDAASWVAYARVLLGSNEFLHVD